MAPDFTQNHFELFGLPVSYAIELGHLDHSYRKLQGEVHPDRFAAATPAERLRSMQLATHVNEAYQTLKSPIARARYLLHMNGIDTQENTNTAMPAEFLMQQMEWREAIEEAREADNIPALDRLLRELHNAAAAHQSHLHAMLDEHKDFASAAETVRKLRFLDKVRTEIEQAIEALED
ncbi:MAG TPA: Fe-S protein assembly co-chaperone HscB [Methylophilaceae bacterium]|nr:Fe-S protein assembly co-chaperone HscB [Methylophilaceae bacterium]